MSSASERFLLGTADNARTARDGSRPAGQSDSRMSEQRLAVVQEAEAGFYRVGYVGADSTVVVESIPGVRVWGDATFALGDRVMVAYIGERPIPFIVSGAGSGGGGGDVDANAFDNVTFFTF